MERGLGKASASYPWGSPVFSKAVRPKKSHPDTGRVGKETKEPISNTGDATEYTNGKFMHSPEKANRSPCWHLRDLEFLAIHGYAGADSGGWGRHTENLFEPCSRIFFITKE
jgi:hypothetical protein